jgi:hypothetical protein
MQNNVVGLLSIHQVNEVFNAADKVDHAWNVWVVTGQRYSDHWVPFVSIR